MKDAADRRRAYVGILEGLFRGHYKPGMTEFEFRRDELPRIARHVGVSVPKNLGDILYSFRYRTELPAEIAKTQTRGREWIIEGIGPGWYVFRLAVGARIVPKDNAYEIRVPDATPQIIQKHALSDEQALLAKVRYNRLIDLFLRVSAYSLQNHVRTTIKKKRGRVQIEIDELYVGVRNTGQQFIVPVQAKGGADQIGVVQVRQDWEYCRQSFPDLTPRLVAVQFKRNPDVIVMFELVMDGENLKIADERHYRLVAADEIQPDDLKTMAGLSD